MAFLCFALDWLPEAPRQYLALLTPLQWHLAVAWISLVSGVGAVLLLRGAEFFARQEEERARLVESRLQLLRAQIRPHFLFNSLTAVAALILRRPEEAHDLVLDLAHSLQPAFKERADWVPLEEELGYVGAYLKVEQARLGERLHVSLEVDPVAQRHRVPSLIIQPLVENAVRHGIAGRSQGGRLHLRVACQDGRLRVVVEDDGVGFDVSVPSRGVGLENVRQRLEALGGELRVQSRPQEGTSVEILVQPV